MFIRGSVNEATLSRSKWWQASGSRAGQKLECMVGNEGRPEQRQDDDQSACSEFSAGRLNSLAPPELSFRVSSEFSMA